MKKIINGKLYNTETAILLTDERRSLHDFYRTSESLYVTRNGNYFIHGQSSAGGRYETMSGTTHGFGEMLIGLSVEDVHAWLETAAINQDDILILTERLKIPNA